MNRDLVVKPPSRIRQPLYEFTKYGTPLNGEHSIYVLKKKCARTNLTQNP